MDSIQGCCSKMIVGKCVFVLVLVKRLLPFGKSAIGLVTSTTHLKTQRYSQLICLLLVSLIGGTEGMCDSRPLLFGVSWATNIHGLGNRVMVGGPVGSSDFLRSFRVKQLSCSSVGNNISSWVLEFVVDERILRLPLLTSQGVSTRSAAGWQQKR